MKMYMSTTPLYNMPLDLTGLLPLGKEVKVGNPISTNCHYYRFFTIKPLKLVTHTGFID
jgi:hypothetical protein